jgi:hypothetical protein
VLPGAGISCGQCAEISAPPRAERTNCLTQAKTGLECAPAMRLPLQVKERSGGARPAARVAPASVEATRAQSGFGLTAVDIGTCRTQVNAQHRGVNLGHGAAIHFFGKFGSFLISRICWMWRSAWVEISSIHCQQSMTSRSPKLWARMSSWVVLMYSIMVARSA